MSSWPMCSLCRDRHQYHKNIRSLIKHYNAYHCNEIKTCKVNECSRKFRTTRWLKTHLRKRHPNFFTKYYICTSHKIENTKDEVPSDPNNDCCLRVLVSYENVNHKLKIKKTTLPALLDDIVTELWIPGKFTVDYFDKDFQLYVRLKDINEIDNLSILRINKDETIHPSDSSTNEPAAAGTASSGRLSSVIHSSSHSPRIIAREPLRNTWHLEYKLPILPLRLEQVLRNDSIISPTSKDELISILYEDIAPRSNFYPKKAQYDTVINLLLENYPNLAGPREGDLSIAAAVWRYKLQNKFRNRRAKDGAANMSVIARKLKREHVDRDEHQSKQIRFCVQWEAPNYLPNYEPGDNEETSVKFIKLLKKEIKNESLDIRKIKSYMDRTFVYRRNCIVKKPFSIGEIMATYPCLQEKPQMYDEIKRIMGDKHTTISDFKDGVLSFYVPSAKIWEMRKRKSPSVTALMKRIGSCQSSDDFINLREKFVLRVVPMLLHEDPENFIFKHDSDKVKPPIYIEESEDGFAVQVEGLRIDNLSSAAEALYYYLGGFFVFNIEPQKKTHKAETFFQKCLFKISDGISVSAPISKLILRMNELKFGRERAI